MDLGSSLKHNVFLQVFLFFVPTDGLRYFTLIPPTQFSEFVINICCAHLQRLASLHIRVEKLLRNTQIGECVPNIVADKDGMKLFQLH